MGDEADRLSEWVDEPDDLDDERTRPRPKKPKPPRASRQGMCDCEPNADHTRASHDAVKEILEEANRPRFPAEQPPGLAGIDRPFSPAERVRVAIAFTDGSQATFYTAFGDPKGEATDEEKAEMIHRDLQHAFIYVNMIVSPRGFTPVAWRQVMFATRTIDSMWILREGERDVDSRRGSYGR